MTSLWWKRTTWLRAAELVAVLAVPERQQDVAMRAHEHAELCVLAGAAGPLLGDRALRAAGRKRQFEDVRRQRRRAGRTARATPA